MPKYWCDFPRSDFSKHDWYIIVVPKTKTIALVVSCVKKSSDKMEIRAANNIVQSLLLLQEHQLPSSLSVQSMTPVLSSHPSCHLGCFPPLLADCRSNSPLGRLSSCTSAPLPLSLAVSTFIVNIMVHTWFQSWPLIIVRGVHLSRLLLREVVLCWRVLKLCAISLSRPLQLEFFSMIKFVFSVRGILPACRTLRIWRPLNFWVGWVFSGVTGQISNKGGQLKALYLYFCK